MRQHNLVGNVYECEKDKMFLVVHDVWPNLNLLDPSKSAVVIEMKILEAPVWYDLGEMGDTIYLSPSEFADNIKPSSYSSEKYKLHLAKTLEFKPKYQARQKTKEEV